MKKRGGKCPICELPYHKKRPRTRHHLFPKVWYKDGVLVEVCRTCHDEFNVLYPMITKWTRATCVKNWVKFCRYKGRNAYEMYPHIKPP